MKYHRVAARENWRDHIDDLREVRDFHHVGVANETVEETGDDERIFEIVFFFDQMRHNFGLVDSHINME